MPKVDKNATPTYEKTPKGEIIRYRVVSDKMNEQKLLDEKAYLEQRLAEINQILGGSNG